MARPLWILIVVVVELLATHADATACLCAPPPPPLEAVEQADAVFLARVTDVEKIEHNNSWFMRTFREWLWDSSLGGHRPNELRVRFEVVEAYKGVDASDALLTTRTSPAACGYTGFEVDRTFLIYAWRHPDHELGTGLCSRTALASEVEEEIRTIREQYAQ